MRSLASGWSKHSVVAVDAGVHLSVITRILEQTQPETIGQSDGPSLPHTLEKGPFAGLEVPHVRAEANAAHIHKELIDTYLITHPHLDHIAGFVINTAGLSGTRPKRLAGLPNTISALKTHVFNNIIWPNLSDENNGAGLVTYTRLVEGGSPALGEGEGRGYLEICDNIAVKAWCVSHGHCIERHSHRGSVSTRHNSFDASVGVPGVGTSPPKFRNPSHHASLPAHLGTFLQQQQQERLQPISASRRGSSLSVCTPNDESVCVYDSSAYFIRDLPTGREILIFGDVEPDSVSLSPRNRQVWQEAAPKIAAGKLSAIFIECSYDDSRCEELLFGHLTPRYIYEELSVLAEEVMALRGYTEAEGRKKSTSSHVSGSSTDKKRRRISDAGLSTKRRTTPQDSAPPRSDTPVSPKSKIPDRRGKPVPNSVPDDAQVQEQPKTRSQSKLRPRSGSKSGLKPTKEPERLDSDTEMTTPATGEEADPGAGATSLAIDGPSQTATSPFANVLKGLKVVVIHVKERMDDGPLAGDGILKELEEHEKEAGLGVEFVMSSSGQSLHL